MTVLFSVWMATMAQPAPAAEPKASETEAPADEVQTGEVKPGVKMGIEIISVPAGATIYLDGRELGKTPFSVEDVELGIHHLMLSLTGFFDWEGEVRLRKGKKSVKSVKLKIDPSPRRRRTFVGFGAFLPVGQKDGSFVIGIGGKLCLEHTFDDYLGYYVEAGAGLTRKAAWPVYAGAGGKFSFPVGRVYPFLSLGVGTGIRYIDVLLGGGAELYLWDKFAIFVKAEVASFFYGDFVVIPGGGAYLRF